MKTTYKTDIILGEKYRDDQTGIEGVATVLAFFQHGCERADLETVVNGEIKTYGFDAPRLTHVKTGVVATTTRTGGPARESASLRRGTAGAR